MCLKIKNKKKMEKKYFYQSPPLKRIIIIGLRDVSGGGAPRSRWKASRRIGRDETNVLLVFKKDMPSVSILIAGARAIGH